MLYNSLLGALSPPAADPGLFGLLYITSDEGVLRFCGPVDFLLTLGDFSTTFRTMILKVRQKITTEVDRHSSAGVRLRAREKDSLVSGCMITDGSVI